MRVVSWNMRFCSAETAARQGELLRSHAPDLVLLQDVNAGSADILRRTAGLDWLEKSADLRVPAPGDVGARAHGVAIAGRGQAPSRVWLHPDAPWPERVLLADVNLGSVVVTVISYYAPIGVKWCIIKPRIAVAVASWLADQSGPLLLGADANTPKIDAADFAHTRTHWHTGDRKLHGEPGDDLLFGPGKIHPLDDALRCWLADHPAAAAGIPLLGPLAVTHHMRRRGNAPDIELRYDSISISPHWTVERIDHLYEERVAAVSDHALVVADLTFSAESVRAATQVAPPSRMAATNPPTPPGRAVPSPRKPRRPTAVKTDKEFIPGHYCRDCGWPFTASQNQTHCKWPDPCQRRQALPLWAREPGCPRNDRAHPEWLALTRQRQS